MRILTLRVIMLCLATVVTLGLSHTTAQACIDIIAGQNAYGKYDCRYSGSCAGWCFYNCTCSALTDGYTCDDVLVEAGFILGESPNCIN